MSTHTRRFGAVELGRIALSLLVLGLVVLPWLHGAHDHAPDHLCVLCHVAEHGAAELPSEAPRAVCPGAPGTLVLRPTAELDNTPLLATPGGRAPPISSQL